jgi:hypothetical protein
LNWANDVANVIPAIPFTGENLLESENPIRLGLIRSSESDELFKYGMALIPKF